VLQCVAVCCSVLQCVAVCCSVLRAMCLHVEASLLATFLVSHSHAPVCCRELQCAAVSQCDSSLKCTASAACCHPRGSHCVLQSIAACCRVLQ